MCMSAWGTGENYPTSTNAISLEKGGSRAADAQHDVSSAHATQGIQEVLAMRRGEVCHLLSTLNRDRYSR